jgi:ribosome maturation factor RimP
VRKLLFLFSLALVIAFGAVAAETLTLTDGSSQSGDIVKFDDNGLMLRTAGDAYVNVPWGKLSQESLKQLTENLKIKPYVEVFIEPDASQRPPKPEIRVNPVSRLERPANPSLFGGLVGSPVGLFILLVLYAANLYAAFEVSIIRARPALQVIGLSAVLPVIGPVIFLALPMKVDAPPEETGGAVSTGVGAEKSPAEIQIVEASWRPEEKPPEAQVFARGKFTFNKRFVETKFASFFGEPKGDALKFSMEVRTTQAQFAVARIMQVAATDVTFVTAPPGQVTVPLADILEIKLTPKTA